MTPSLAVCIRLVLCCVLMTAFETAALELDPVSLPKSEPDVPALWFAPEDRAGLVERMAAPRTDKHFNAVKGYVDGRTKKKLAGRSDDELSKIAKGAALLANLDLPSPSPVYDSYAAAAVAALQALGPRSAAVSPLQLVVRPADRVNILQDCSRLQSALEAYDMLRGNPALEPGAATDKGIRSRLAQWANALHRDLEMSFHPTDNWSAKNGAALVTAALVLSEHPDAAAWLKQGQTWLNGALRVKATDSGWYRESAHYLNYTLNNLVSTAHHVRNRTGVDWFDEELRPFVDYALATRLPNGEMAAFEEGVPCTFPFDVLASAYPKQTRQMLWAWNNSPKNASAYENQQFHAATRFLLAASGAPAEWPGIAPFQTIEDEGKTVVLRSDWTADALQTVLFCANDDKAGGTASRHVTQNPLDLVLFAHGQMRVPTSSGGPLVTRSKNRAYFLDPANKNLPLVDGSAPYITDATTVELSGVLQAGGFSTATLQIPGVKRTVIQFEQEWTLVVDRFAPGLGEKVAQVWHPLGLHTNLVTNAQFLHNRWTLTAPTELPVMDVYTFADVDLKATPKPGIHVPKWGVEKPLRGLRIAAEPGARGTSIASLFVCRALKPDPPANPRIRRPRVFGVQGRLGVRDAMGQIMFIYLGPMKTQAFESDAGISVVRGKEVLLIDASSVRRREDVVQIKKAAVLLPR